MEEKTINYAEKYAGKVDERFSLGSLTEGAVNHDYDWSGSDTVHVYAIPTVDMTDYAMQGSSRYGPPAELQDSVQTMTLSRDRSFTFTIDRRNYTDTMMTKEAGKALARQMDEVVIPEIDTYRLAKLCEHAGTTATGAITKGNAYGSFLAAQAALTDSKGPHRKLCIAIYS